MKLSHLLAGAALIALPTLTQAQPTAHYVPGVEGIKAASLPPPGVYLRDYNVFYYSDHLDDQNGNKISALNAKAYVYANVPRLIWITPVQVLGGNLGVDALLPVEYQDLELSSPAGPLFNDKTFGLGDVFAEGTWSKHLKQWDFSLGYGVWFPTGNSSATSPSTRAGLGYYTHMFTAGATWYIDTDKKWAISALNRYEINSQKDDAGYTPGQAYTVEGGLSYTVIRTLEFGAVSYYQQKVTSDSGFGTTDARDRVAAIGPEINTFISPLGVSLSLRYLYEFLAENRLQGHTAVLTLTKRF